MNKTFIPKEHPDLPDNYSIEISYLDGSKESIEAASHRLGDKFLEVATKEDKFIWVFQEGVKRIEFDKRFSKIVAIKNGEQ